MQDTLKRIGYAFLVLIGLVALAFPLARLADGPMGMLPGGLLTSGELLPTPLDWRFAEAIQEIELESGGSSRTVWIVVGGTKRQAFIPASLDFPPFKTWHQEARDDPDAMVRIAGKRYPVTLEYIPPSDAAYTNTLLHLLDKYMQDAPPLRTGAAPNVWIFRLNPRRIDDSMQH